MGVYKRGQKGGKMNDLIKRAEAIDVLNVGAELLRRVLDDTDIVGIERKNTNGDLV